MKLFKIRNPHLVFVIIVGVIFLVYAFTLAYKRYVNFEYGKFDLGNMSQMVWNTSRGRFMEVTDQFGTNMPRWGMSHVDPILIIFSPIYWVYEHPMILVFFQHIVIVSAVLPIYLLCVRKFKSRMSAVFVVMTYLMYPALGFTLVWTGYHGISFVAPLFIWLVWVLERPKINMSAYWLLIIIMLLGKEEVGAILAIYSLFIYSKNKKLAIQTFLISFSWFIIAFFIIIPAYSDLRIQSISTFTDKTSIVGVNPSDVGEDNFFIHRYDYLGKTYPQMLKNVFLNPKLMLEVAFTKDKLIAINNLVGPLGYLVLIVPVWIVSIPDLAIVLLSKDEIFDISNHRIAFVISALFISYIYFLARYKLFDRKVLHISYRLILSFLVMVLSVYFSSVTNNPIYVSGESFLKTKIVSKVFSSSENLQESSIYNFGFERRAQVPRNDNECLRDMSSLIDSKNPNIYTGPDYLGAHSSNRLVNALYPSRYWDADLVLVDLFETKTTGPLASSGWAFNKESLRRLLENSEYMHIYSCGKISAFERGTPKDSSSFIDPLDYVDYENFDKNKFEFGPDKIKLALSYEYLTVPESIGRNSKEPIRLLVQKAGGDFMDKTTFWTFENKYNKDIKFVVIDYLSSGYRGSLDRAEVGQVIFEEYYPIIPDRFPAGEYNIFFGVGDLLNAKEVFIGHTKVN